MAYPLSDTCLVDLEDIQGSGGTGSVFSAKADTVIKRITYRKSIGFKRYGQPDEKVKEVGKKEVQTLLKLGHHRNIVKLIDYFDDGISIWITLEKCTLGNLETYVQTKYLILTERLQIVKGCSSGLHHMHSSFPQPISHGDVKPRNILMKKEGVEDIPKLCDFSGSSFTYTFAAPEHFMKEGVVGLPADIFSLGLVLYWIITNKSKGKCVKIYTRD